MRKTSRKIALGFVLFAISSGCLLVTVEEAFLRCILKGGLVAAVVIPAMNMYYGDKKRFKFSY